MGDKTPISISIILKTTTNYLEPSFSFINTIPYEDILFEVTITYPTDYLDTSFVMYISSIEDYEFKVTVPDEDVLSHIFRYVVPTDSFIDITTSIFVGEYAEWLFYVEAGPFYEFIDVSFEAHLAYNVTEFNFYTAVQTIDYKDINYFIYSGEYTEHNFSFHIPDNLDVSFILYLGVEYVDTDFYVKIAPEAAEFLDRQYIAYLLGEDEVGISTYVGVVPQYRTVNRIRIKEHPNYGSINFSLLYQQDIDEPYQLFNINNATVNELPILDTDPLMTNPIVGNIYRNGEILDLYLDPVICTSVRLIITKTESLHDQVRIAELGIFEDIIRSFVDVTVVGADPIVHHIKDMWDQPENEIRDIITINTHPEMGDSAQQEHADISFVKFVPIHTPDVLVYIDYLRLHIMQTYYFEDFEFLVAEHPPYEEFNFFMPTPDYEDWNFWIPDWAYLENNFIVHGPVSFEDWNLHLPTIAPGETYTSFLTYSPDFEEKLFYIGNWPEDQIIINFTSQSDIDDKLVDFIVALAEYVEHPFEFMIPDFEEYNFFFRSWNFEDYTFYLTVMQGGYVEFSFDAGVVMTSYEESYFFAYLKEYGYEEYSFDATFIDPYLDTVFEMYHDKPYLDHNFYLFSTRKSEGILHGAFDISNTIKQSLPGSFNILNRLTKAVLHGSFDIAGVSGRSIITMAIMRPEDKEQLDAAGITVP